MKIIFNLLLLIPLIVELNRALSPVKAWELGKRFREAKKANPENYHQDILNGEDGDTLKAYVISYIIIIIGLLSSQWIIFLAYTLFDIVFNKLRLQRLVIGVFINALVGTLLMLFAIANGLHLHYNLYHILISMF